MFSSASARHLEFPPELREPVTVADDDDDAPLANIPRQHAGVYMCLLQHYTPNVPVCSSSPPTLPRISAPQTWQTRRRRRHRCLLHCRHRHPHRRDEEGRKKERLLWKKKPKSRRPPEFLGLALDQTGANWMRGTITQTAPGRRSEG